MIPPRLAPLVRQFDFACERLTARLKGPTVDSGDGTPIAVNPMTDDEFRWNPTPDSWSVRRRSAEPPVPFLAGRGEWGRESPPHPP